jgi:hypothetical protein
VRYGNDGFNGYGSNGIYGYNGGYNPYLIANNIYDNN